MLLPLLLVFLASCVLWLVSFLRRPANFPPDIDVLENQVLFVDFLTQIGLDSRPRSVTGPPGLFSITQLKQAGEPLYFKTMTELSNQFGPMVGLFFAHKRFVCVSKYEAIKEVLSNPDLTGRPNSFVFALRTKHVKAGIITTDGDLWKEQRRFIVRHLRDFGFGKTSMEDLIKDEISDLINDLEKKVECSADGNVYFDNLFHVSALNIVWALVAGSKFRRNDPEIEKAVRAVTDFIRAITVGDMIELLPILRFVAPEKTGYNNLVKCVNVLRTYIEDVIQDHRRTFNGENRDLIDVYLNQIESENGKTDTHFTEEQMMGVIMDLFTAGVETSSNSLAFALIYMIHHPDVQTKVQEEIDAVLDGNPVSLSDMARLPYTGATLLEIQRLGVVAPITVPHVALKNTTCYGYSIPKGTTIFVNLWSVFMEPTIWDQPLQFRPERHLDGQGNLIKSEYMLTFGFGKRVCLGESLARNTVFLFFVSVMQRFRLAMPLNPADPSLIPSLKPLIGLTLGPGPCLVNVTTRKS